MIDRSPHMLFARAYGPSGDSGGFVDAACTADVGVAGPGGKDLSIGRSNGTLRQLEPTAVAA